MTAHAHTKRVCSCGVLMEECRCFAPNKNIVVIKDGCPRCKSALWCHCGAHLQTLTWRDPEGKEHTRYANADGPRIGMEHRCGAGNNVYRRPVMCTCADWLPQIEKLNAPIVLQQVRAGEQLPDDYFKLWAFCPWCGKAL